MQYLRRDTNDQDPSWCARRRAVRSRRVVGSRGEGRQAGLAGLLHLWDWMGKRVQYTQIAVSGVVMRHGQDRCRAQVEQKGLTARAAN